jgi:hypothetical protein
MVRPPDPQVSTPVDLSISGHELRQLCLDISRDAEALAQWVESEPQELTISTAMAIRVLCQRSSRVRHLVHIAVHRPSGRDDTLEWNVPEDARGASAGNLGERTRPSGGVDA